MSFEQSPEEFKQIAERQSQIAESIAIKLLKGRKLDSSEAGFAVAVLRDWSAQRASLRQPRRRGQSPMFCHITATLMYSIKLANRVPKTLAADEVAEALGVSRPAVLRAIKAHDSLLKARLELFSHD